MVNDMGVQPVMNTLSSSTERVIYTRKSWWSGFLTAGKDHRTLCELFHLGHLLT